MSSCKHEIPVLARFLTKQVFQIPEKKHCIDLCLFKNSFISPGSKLQFKVQKICTTTRTCLFPDTLYSLIPHNEGQLERLVFLHLLFMFTGSQHPSLQLVPQLSSTDLPPATKSILKAPKSALKQRKINVPANA